MTQSGKHLVENIGKHDALADVGVRPAVCWHPSFSKSVLILFFVSEVSVGNVVFMFNSRVHMNIIYYILLKRI